MTITMYDSIDLSQFPDNPEAVAGYVGGYWPTYNELVAKFPKAHHLSIAVNERQRARCLDIEPGNCGPEDGPGWYRNYADDSEGPIVIYCGASAAQSVINAMKGAGIGRDQYLLWTAHYTYSEHICGGGACDYPEADGTQWTDKAMGRNLDQSALSEVFFGEAPKPAPETPEGEMMTVVKEDGRLETFVLDERGQVWHTWQTATDGGWQGSAPGKTTTWQSLGTPGG